MSAHRSWMLFALLPLMLTPRSAQAEATQDSHQTSPIQPTEGQRWLLGATLHLAPFEFFPQLGAGLHGFYHLSQRWHLGAEANFYAPRQSSYIRRFAFSTNLQAQLTLISVQRFRWYGLAGIGLGVFRDSYAPRSPLEDQTAVGAGMQLGTGIELGFPASLSAFVEPRAVSYRTRSAADDEWLEVALGLRWRP